MSEWVSAKLATPAAGVQVVALRPNGTWDRSEYNPIYFEGLGAWYFPEGPWYCASWHEDGVEFWMPVPKAPKAEGWRMPKRIQRKRTKGWKGL